MTSIGETQIHLSLSLAEGKGERESTLQYEMREFFFSSAFITQLQCQFTRFYAAPVCAREDE